MSDWRLIHGDCLEAMRAMPAASVDAVVTDPPYDLTGNVKGGGAGSVNPANRGQTSSPYAARSGFMGMPWDGTGIAFRPETWAEALRVVKPGGYLLAFGGSRTYHRMAVAIEDAGWEIRDSIMWVYGQGFPKSHNLPGGLGTALKPAHEPIVMARAPLVGTVAANVAAYGTGALNIDAGRVGGAARPAIISRAKAGNYSGVFREGSHQEGCTTAGRWPANLILSHHPDCEPAGVRRVRGSHDTTGIFGGATPDAYERGWPAERPPRQGYTDADGMETIEAWRCVEGCPVAEMDRQSGVSKSTGGRNTGKPTNVYGHYRGLYEPGDPGYGDTGGASRFFYVAKASASERSAGLDERSPHPTVKPLALMRHLVRLVCPPGGLVLDPFAGSGTTGCAAVLEGMRFLGIEQEAEYVTIAERRIAHWAGEALPLFAGVAD